MSRAIFGIVIGALSFVCYVLATGFIIYALTQGGNEEIELNENGEFVTKTNKWAIGLMVLSLILSIIMAVLSVLLIIGIKQKRYKFMSPWLNVSMAFVIYSTFKIISNFIRNKPNPNLTSTIITIVIQIAVLYPIYTLYKDIKNNSRADIAAPPQNVVFNPTTIPNQNSSYPNTNYNQLPQQKV